MARRLSCASAPAVRRPGADVAWRRLVPGQSLERIAQTEGAEAVKTCEKEASEETGAKSASVSNIEVDGSKATAEVALTGGSLDGQGLEVALVKQGDQWKLNEITGFTKFDQAKVIETIEEGFAEPSSEVSKSVAACITGSFEEAPQAEFEDALLSPSAEGFEEIAGDCF